MFLFFIMLRQAAKFTKKFQKQTRAKVTQNQTELLSSFKINTYLPKFLLSFRVNGNVVLF